MNKSISNNKRLSRWKKFMKDLTNEKTDRDTRTAETVQETHWSRGYMGNSSNKTMKPEVEKRWKKK
jgi:hypothetical protein